MDTLAISQRSTRIERICANCGIVFFIPAAWARKGAGRTCSRKCYSEYQRKHPHGARGKEEPPKPIPATTCAECGAVFAPKSRTQRFCSRACYEASRGAAPMVERMCKQCGRPYTVQARFASREYCSSACRQAATQIPCARCGQMFQPKRPDIKHCSEVCRRPYKKTQCLVCGKSFRVRPSEQGLHRFCSLRCYRAYDGPTVPELRTADALNALSITFEREAHIKGTNYHCDFLLPDHRTVVEVDHPYWHSETAKRDAMKDQRIRALGFRVVRIQADAMRGATLTPAMLAHLEPVLSAP